jgi:hypothetical protein
MSAIHAFVHVVQWLGKVEHGNEMQGVLRRRRWRRFDGVPQIPRRVYTHALGFGETSPNRSEKVRIHMWGRDAISPVFGMTSGLIMPKSFFVDEMLGGSRRQQFHGLLAVLLDHVERSVRVKEQVLLGVRIVVSFSGEGGAHAATNQSIVP